MSAHPISNPKIAIVASLLMGGALTIAALELRPDGQALSTDQANVETRTTFASTSEASQRPGALASGHISPGSEDDAGVSQALDAVRFCLEHNDLESARLLLKAERVLHQDDPRVLTLQRELQAREASTVGVQTVTGALHAAAVAELPRVASHPIIRTEHSRYAQRSTKESTASASRYARAQRAAQVETAARAVQKVEAPNSLLASGETKASPEKALPAAAQIAQAPVAPVQVSEPLPQTVLAGQAGPVAQPAQSEPTIAQSAPGSMTRAQVRMELERARADGALPRFGNPDPAGPGGASSMTVDPGSVSR
jgi:hypothetical protein